MEVIGIQIITLQSRAGKFYVNDIWYQVIGVVENVLIKQAPPHSDIWVPVSTTKANLQEFTFFGNYQAIILAQNKSDIDRIKREFKNTYKKAQLPEPDKYDQIKCQINSRIEELTSLMKGRSWAEEGRQTFFNFVTINIIAMLLFILLPILNLLNINILLNCMLNKNKQFFYCFWWNSGKNKIN